MPARRLEPESARIPHADRHGLPRLDSGKLSVESGYLRFVTGTSPKKRSKYKQRLPRLRGDGPERSSMHEAHAMAPPPTRGWTHRVMNVRAHISGSPAYAGMDRQRWEAGDTRAQIPRLRGDGPAKVAMIAAGAQAPPPTRGWTRSTAPPRHPPDGCPANAGMDRTTEGEVALHGRNGQNISRGSPAYAGMDPRSPSRQCPRDWLPRLRGDGPQARHRPLVAIVAPPPTRGWTLDHLRHTASLAGSPAYAGDPRPRSA